MLDKRGYRTNVGIIIVNDKQQVLLAKRSNTKDAWQFPQGGIQENEEISEAMYRELYEELGLSRKEVAIIAVSRRWLRYRLPKHFRRFGSKPICIGQRQRWYLLSLTGAETNIKLDTCKNAEFDHWCWVDYWEPVKRVIYFKRKVYQRILKEFAQIVFGK